MANESSGNPSQASLPPYPTGPSFADFLKWHMDVGTRDCDPKKRQRTGPWTRKDLGSTVLGGQHADRTIGNWLSQATKPTSQDFLTLERVLFGNDQSEAYTRWRSDLRKAWEGKVIDQQRNPLMVYIELAEYPVYLFGYSYTVIASSAATRILFNQVIDGKSKGEMDLIFRTLIHDKYWRRWDEYQNFFAWWMQESDHPLGLHHQTFFLVPDPGYPRAAYKPGLYKGDIYLTVLDGTGFLCVLHLVNASTDEAANLASEMLSEHADTTKWFKGEYPDSVIERYLGSPSGLQFAAMLRSEAK